LVALPSPSCLHKILHIFTEEPIIDVDITITFEAIDANEGMTPRVLILAYLVPAKEEARSKDS
jgi:hypothetical protein